MSNLVLPINDQQYNIFSPYHIPETPLLKYSFIPYQNIETEKAELVYVHLWQKHVMVGNHIRIKIITTEKLLYSNSTTREYIPKAFGFYFILFLLFLFNNLLYVHILFPDGCTNDIRFFIVIKTNTNQQQSIFIFGGFRTYFVKFTRL